MRCHDMKSTKEENITLIRKLSEAKAPSGFEDESIAVGRAFAQAFANIEEDRLRNLYVTRRENKGDRPVFMLDAHGDEVGMMIHSIKPNGTLRFVTLGRFTPGTLPGAKVWVRNRNGEYIPGIVAAKPPHFMSAEERNRLMDVADLVIDIGARSAEEAKEIFGIQIGEPAVSAVDFSYDDKRDILIGKGFDCRIGCAAMLETMKRLTEEDVPMDVIGVMSSQEEVGDRGVKVAVDRIRPNVAICFEGCPADDTFTETYAIQTALKKGPMIRFMDVSMIANPRYMRDTIALAEKHGIPLQASVRTGGGNNGAVINLAGEGIPVIVIGIPVRYIHSHYGIASYQDFEVAVELAVNVVKEMTPEKAASF